MSWKIQIIYKETADAEWQTEYFGSFETEDEADEAQPGIVNDWLDKHDPYEWDWDVVEIVGDDELETVNLCLTVSMKAGSNVWNAMRVLEDRFYEIDGAWQFQYAEQEEV